MDGGGQLCLQMCSTSSCTLKAQHQRPPSCGLQPHGGSNTVRDGVDRVWHGLGLPEVECRRIWKEMGFVIISL